MLLMLYVVVVVSQFLYLTLKLKYGATHMTKTFVISKTVFNIFCTISYTQNVLKGYI